jgi:hypothetical protein
MLEENIPLKLNDLVRINYKKLSEFVYDMDEVDF